MTVLLPNTRLGLRRRVIEEARNSHGERVPAGWGQVVGLYDGRTNETAEGTWALGLDPALWPVRKDDLVIAPSGAMWLVQTADLIQNNYDSYVDWVRVSGLLRSLGGTEPGGAWFVARYTPGLDDTIPDPQGEPILTQPGLWTGTGPPPATPFGAETGDEYLDLSTGFIYRLGP